MAEKQTDTRHGPHEAALAAPRRRRSPAPAPAAAVHYEVSVADAAAHRYAVVLTVARPAPVQRVSLPAWIPGSYLIREFARHLQGLQASQGKHPCTVLQVDKSTWDVPCDPRRPLRLAYQVYAFDSSVRAAWLDAQGRECVMEVSMVKALCGELVNDVVYDCQQFHGGFGYMREAAIERMVRDARVQAIGGGASEVMLEEVAKRL